MTQHSSLKSDSVGTRHRNVLKRYERIQQLKNSETAGGQISAFKLPKVRLIKMKVKKVKAVKEGAEAKTEGQASQTPQTQSTAPGQKAAAQKAPVEKAKGKEKA